MSSRIWRIVIAKSHLSRNFSEQNYSTLVRNAYRLFVPNNLKKQKFELNLSFQEYAHKSQTE